MWTILSLIKQNHCKFCQISKQTQMCSIPKCDKQKKASFDSLSARFCHDWAKDWPQSHDKRENLSKFMPDRKNWRVTCFIVFWWLRFLFPRIGLCRFFNDQIVFIWLASLMAQFSANRIVALFQTSKQFHGDLLRGKKPLKCRREKNTWWMLKTEKSLSSKTPPAFLSKHFPLLTVHSKVEWMNEW